uniref:Vigilin n=1 Tax=Globodera pallida TaxID=36090 RepID=A0A183C4E2_GLOPA
MASEKKTLDYSVDFPQLPDASAVTSTSASSIGVWAAATQPAIKSSVITEAFKLSAEERASRGFGKTFGTASEEQQKCNQIAKLTGTTIELNEAKDQSITILISGKQKCVEDARTRLVRELQTQATVKLDIPKDYHSYVIGKQGIKLRQLEHKFLCRIHMPGREEKSDTIRIVGPNEYILEAAKHIQGIADEMAKQKTEALDIPRTFYPWIRGINNEKLDELVRRTGAKVNIPPTHANNETIIVTGEREGVEVAAAEILKIFNEKKETVVSVEVTVPKAQHRYVIGPKRAGLDEIFRDTEVLVELPSEDNDSETVILRGPKDKIGDAAGAVYQKASSNIAIELPYKEWMRRHLIGPKGQHLHSLVPNQDRLKIDFEENVIYIEGPTEQVKQAQQQLGAEITRLENEPRYEAMRTAPSDSRPGEDKEPQTKIQLNVDPKHHRHFIIRGAEVLKEIQAKFNCQISFPKQETGDSMVTIRGRDEVVQGAKARIEAIVEDLEAQRQVQLDIDPKHHRHFIIRGAEVLKEIQAKFNCQISFPKQETGDSAVTIRGRDEGVQGAKARIEAIVENLEAQRQIQLEIDPKHHRHFIIRGAEATVKLDIPKDYHSYVIGKQGIKLRQLEHKFLCRIHMPGREEKSDTIRIVGPNEYILEAAKHIQGIADEMAKQKTEALDIPRTFYPWIRGINNEKLDELVRRTGAKVNIPPTHANNETIIVTGEREGVEVAAAEILKIFNEKLEIDPKHHRHFIIRGAEVLKDIQKKFNCQVSFPKQETGDSQITIRGRDENVQKAKARIEAIVEDLESQTQVQLDVDPKYHRHFIARGAEVLKDIQKKFNCQVSFPKQETGDSVVTIRGRVENVERAKARIEEIIAELFDLYDESQYVVRREEPPPPKPEPNNIEMVNAPWQLDSVEQFPGLSDGGVAAQQQQKPVSATAVWGQRR